MYSSARDVAGSPVVWQGVLVYTSHDIVTINSLNRGPTNVFCYTSQNRKAGSLVFSSTLGCSPFKRKRGLSEVSIPLRSVQFVWRVSNFKKKRVYLGLGSQSFQLPTFSLKFATFFCGHQRISFFTCNRMEQTTLKLPASANDPHQSFFLFFYKL